VPVGGRLVQNRKDKSISPITGPRCPEGSRKLRFPDYVTMAQDGGKVISLTRRSLLPPGNTPGTHFCFGLSRPQGHSATGRIMSMKTITPFGIEPATIRFVAQHLQQNRKEAAQKEKRYTRQHRNAEYTKKKIERISTLWPWSWTFTV